MAARRHSCCDHLVQGIPFRFCFVVNRRDGGVDVGEDIPHRNVLAEKAIVDGSGGITVICRDLSDRRLIRRFIARSPRAAVDKQEQTGRAALIRGDIQIVRLEAVRPVGLVQKLFVIDGGIVAASDAEQRGKECHNRHKESDDFVPHMYYFLLLKYKTIIYENQ